MPKGRDPESHRAEEMFRGGMSLVEIASQLNIPEGTIRSWKNRYQWNATLRKKDCNVAKRKGGQPGNTNSVGHGVPKGNKNAEKHGFFAKYLPEETLSIIQEMPDNPLDILWDQIQIQYAAIIRAQKIMYVKDKKDKTKSKVGEKHGNVSGEEWEIQYAWDKQGNFLQAQSRAVKTLEGLVTRYEELLHKNWDMTTEEQRARIDQIKAQTDKIRLDTGSEEEEGGIEIVNDAPKETGENI